jgi:ATP phosphoribosyltransferase
VALPKGRLSIGVLALLRPTYGVRFPSERSVWAHTEAGLRFCLVKPRAIPDLLFHGDVAAGIVGNDVVEDAGHEGLVSVAHTSVGRVSVVAAAADPDILRRPAARPLRVATEYPGVAARWARGRGMPHVVQRTYGSTEGYVPDFADLCVDVVETGDTLRAQGLSVVETIFHSSACLFVRRDGGAPAQALSDFIERVRLRA